MSKKVNMILIKNAMIKTMAGKDIPNGCILIEGDKIKKIGENLTTPAGAHVIDATGRLTTPGLIDGHSHVGLFGEACGWEGDDGNEMTDPITPHMRAIDSINPMDEGFKTAVTGGVTVIGTGPGSGNAIGGTFTCIKLHGNRVDDMILRDNFAMKIAFGENPKWVYGQHQKKSPSTRMATAALIRETLFKAQRYSDELLEYEKSTKKDKKKPPFEMKMEALLPVMRRKIPLKAHAHRTDDIFTALRIAREFNLDITLEHCTEGHLIVDALVQENKFIFIGPSFGSKSKLELLHMSFDTAKILSDAGLKIAIITDAPVIPQQNLAMCAGFAVKAGMNEDKAWEAITVTPAKAMGVFHRVGSLEKGKDADIAIFNGNPLFEIGCTAAYTIINGKIVHDAG
ncbi:MAG: amidohydrolase [Treponema sp.]|nr:amidohydrolase [Treponema sp.]